MRAKSIFTRRLLLAALLFFSRPMDAAGPAEKIFEAAPGTDTLLAARDAVRVWRAAGHADAPAVIRLAPGEYTLAAPLVLEQPDGNTTWLAPLPDKTMITGGRRITGFTPDANGVWRASTDFPFEQLYVNGRRAARARLPETGFYPIEKVQSEDLPGGRARLTVKIPDAAAAVLAANPTAVRAGEMLVFHKWDTSRYAVIAFDAAARTVTVEGERMKPWNPWDQQSRFVLDNYPAASLAPGCWHLDTQGILSYAPLPGEVPAKSDFVAPVVEKFLEIRGAENLHFTGLRFHHAAYRLPAAGCPPVQAAATIGAAVEMDDARNVTLTNCEIAHTGNYAVWFRRGCRDGRIEHCLLADLGAGGLRIGETAIRESAAGQTAGIVADNNIIRGCGRVHPSAVGVWIGQSANNRVTHNDISDTFYTGISVGWTWGYGRSLATNNFIGFNRVHQIGQGALSDLGGIYTLGVSPSSVCVGNVFYDVRAHVYGGWGIYLDEGSTGWRIESNLVWNCTCVNARSGGGFHQHYGATNLIANNIFAFSSGPPMQATRVEDHLSFALERNLIVSSNTPFFTGPWDKIQFASSSNCFAYFGKPTGLFPGGDLAAWQQAGHETGSLLTNFTFTGNWPDVSLPRRSPARLAGFKMFVPAQAGVYGDRGWKQKAAATP
jgi:hypothetical protein